MLVSYPLTLLLALLCSCFSKNWENTTCEERKRAFYPKLFYKGRQAKTKANVLKYGTCNIFDTSFSNSKSNEDVKIMKRYFSRAAQRLDDPISIASASLPQKRRDIKTNGFFLEMRSLNGVQYSTSLIYEYCFGWNGILVEANFNNYIQTQRHRPCATSIWAAICPANASSYVYMPDQKETSSLLKQEETKKKDEQMSSSHSATPCRTMASIFRDHHVKHIDFWSLDMEGSELITLQTVDWTQVAVGVLIIEESRDADEIHRLLTTAGMFKMTRDPEKYPACLYTKKQINRKVILFGNRWIYVHESMRDDLNTHCHSSSQSQSQHYPQQQHRQGNSRTELSRIRRTRTG